MKRLMFILFLLLCTSFSSKKDILTCLTTFNGTTAFQYNKLDHNGAYSKPFRVVKTVKGNETITVTDTYTVHYKNKFDQPKLKVKIEISDTAGYLIDKEIIKDNLSYILSHTKNISMDRIEEFTMNDFTFYGMTKKTIDSSSFIGNYILFPGKNIVAYFNFINNKNDTTNYSTIQEFNEYRNTFFKELTNNLRKCD